MGRTAPHTRSSPPHAPPRARRPGLLPVLPALCVFLVLGLGAPASALPWDLAAADRYCHKLDIREDVGEAIALARTAAAPRDAIVITGSLFTVASALRTLGLRPLG